MESDCVADPTTTLEARSALSRRSSTSNATGSAPPATSPDWALAAPGIDVVEVANLSLITLALPYGVDGDTLSQMVEAAFDITLPTLGSSSKARHGERFLGLHQDRLFVLFDTPADDRPAGESSGDGVASEAHCSTAEITFLERLRNRDSLDPDEDDGSAEPAIFLNDQSDSWMMLRMSGTRCRQALERICPLDLHPDMFELDDVARTVMEHLSVVILRESEDGFLLLSPRSSARSFVHEIEVSVTNVRDLQEI